MKRCVSFLLAAVMLLSLFGCVKKSSHAEEFLIAARTLDLDAMSAHVVLPATSSAVPLAQEKHYASMLDEQKKEVIVALYSLMQYTIQGESAVEDGMKTVKITLKVPDFSRIKSLAHTNIVVSGKSAAQIVSEMIEDGTVAKSYMTEKNLEVKMKQQDGEFFVLCDDRENAALFEALGLPEMLRFFASN